MKASDQDGKVPMKYTTMAQLTYGILTNNYCNSVFGFKNQLRVVIDISLLIVLTVCAYIWDQLTIARYNHCP